ncbi:MAG: GNAT family N-acetyltransferase [Clostridiales bacterium]|nr:GNAT family N-acetyltransferase [Clostridiales bacterium]
MQDVYKECPVLENERFLLRLVEEGDVNDLLKVYGDKAALPFFNSDNCHGSNFYITSEKYMLETIEAWLKVYSNREFVRFAIIDKVKNMAIGTIELFNRKADDYFNNCGLLRLDLRPDYENSRDIVDVLSVIIEPAYSLFDCDFIATKAPIYAVDRIDALKEMGFMLSNECIRGAYGEKVYDGYWVKDKN